MLLFDLVLSCHKQSPPQGSERCAYKVCTRFEARSLYAGHWLLHGVPMHQLCCVEAASSFSPRAKASSEGQAETSQAILAEHSGF